MSKIRLALIFIASLLDEAIAVVFLLWVLPMLGIRLPVQALVTIIAVLAVYAVVSFLLIMRALVQKPAAGLIDMVGSRGRVVSPLCPEGCVRVRGETWQGVSTEGNVGCGEDVVVVSQDGLKLTVRRLSQDGERGN